MTSTSRHAHVVGLGLIGASVALALTRAGWTVSGFDTDGDVASRALDGGFISSLTTHDSLELVVIATPAGMVAAIASTLLAANDNPDLIVTDVAGVKQAIVHDVADSRFLGGHPMAGSEQRGLQGARGDLFHNCTWVLTPTQDTPALVYSRLHGILREIEANVVAVSPEDHDRLVAIASHVPHLLAGALMNQAAEAAEQDAVLLQLAAGGFRDMTRVAAGDPAIWPDILFQNRHAIEASLLDLERRLARLRESLDQGDRPAVEADLETASVARRRLPGRALRSEDMAYLRVGLLDRPGSLASVTMVASELLVNIYDIEIAHGIEGASGTLLLTVDRSQAAALTKALGDIGFRVAVDA